jgi:hypothetical protein
LYHITVHDNVIDFPHPTHHDFEPLNQNTIHFFECPNRGKARYGSYQLVVTKNEHHGEATTTPDGKVPPHPLPTRTSSQIGTYMYSGYLRFRYLTVIVVVVTCYTEMQ